MLQTEIPCFNAKPERGLTCASYPSGNCINNPVGTNFLSNGRSVIASSILALKSIPASFGSA